MTKLRFALLFDGLALESWHLDCLDQLEQVAELSTVLIANDQRPFASPRRSSMAMRWYVRRVERRTVVNVDSRFGAVPRVGLDRSGVPGELPPLDFILRLGRSEITPTLAQAARHGVWYFEHEEHPDLLPFFGEVHEAKDVTHAALKAFTSETFEPAVLEEGYLPTAKLSYRANRDRATGLIAAWPQRVCERISNAPASRRRLHRREAIPPPIAFRRRARLLPFATAIAWRRLKLAWARLFRHPQWNIGVLKASADSLLRAGAYREVDIEWFPLNGRRRFLADPFGVVRDGVLHILCECYSYRESKGHIASLTYSNTAFGEDPETAITLPVHMSYPLLVEDAGEIYCVPETSEANEIALFRANQFPHGWSKVAVIVPEFRGIDPTVFEHDGRWWLMCTEKGPYEDVELLVWHAPTLAGPWEAHLRNPVKSDVRGARPAGPPFVHEGVLHRPAQDCSTTYGGRITLQRVTRLTPTEFVEHPVVTIEASRRDRFPCGPHTLTVVRDDLILIDSRRTVFVWLATLAFLRIWAHGLLRRLATVRRPSGGNSSPV